MWYNIVLWTLVWFMQGTLCAMAGYQLNILSAAESFSSDFLQVSRDINYIAPYEILFSIICNILTGLVLKQWTLFLLQLPMTFFNLYRYHKQLYILDATEVYKPGVLKSRINWCIIRIIVYCIFFGAFFIAVVYDIFYGHFLNNQSNFFLTWIGLGADKLHPVKHFLGKTADMAANEIDRLHKHFQQRNNNINP